MWHQAVLLDSGGDGKTKISRDRFVLPSSGRSGSVLLGVVAALSFYSRDRLSRNRNCHLGLYPSSVTDSSRLRAETENPSPRSKSKIDTARKSRKSQKSAKWGSPGSIY